jgi:hypothetical protein
MQATLNAIRDTLPGNLDKLYSGLADKINTGRKIYVTGYATFFDNSTKGCDNTTWAFWFNSQNKQMLTTERRMLMKTTDPELIHSAVICFSIEMKG